MAIITSSLASIAARRASVGVLSVSTAEYSPHQLSPETFLGVRIPRLMDCASGRRLAGISASVAPERDDV
jgi:hypothetical protein